MQPRCAYCLLPIRLKFAHCIESGIRGPMIDGTLRPGAIVVDPGELRWCKPVDVAKLKSERKQ